MTASSWPASSRLILPALGSHERTGIFGCPLTRFNLMTSWPWLARNGMSAEPRSPEAPVSRIFMSECDRTNNNVLSDARRQWPSQPPHIHIHELHCATRVAQAQSATRGRVGRKRELSRFFAAALHGCLPAPRRNNKALKSSRRCAVEL